MILRVLKALIIIFTVFSFSNYYIPKRVYAQSETNNSENSDSQLPSQQPSKYQASESNFLFLVILFSLACSGCYAYVVRKS